MTIDQRAFVDFSNLENRGPDYRTIGEDTFKGSTLEKQISLLGFERLSQQVITTQSSLIRFVHEENKKEFGYDEVLLYHDMNLGGVLTVCVRRLGRFSYFRMQYKPLKDGLFDLNKFLEEAGYYVSEDFESLPYRRPRLFILGDLAYSETDGRIYEREDSYKNWKPTKESLSRLQSQLLEILAINSPIVVGYHNIRKLLWDDEADEDRTNSRLNALIAYLRQKVDPERKFIYTIIGSGYQFMGEIRYLDLTH